MGYIPKVPPSPCAFCGFSFQYDGMFHKHKCKSSNIEMNIKLNEKRRLYRLIKGVPLQVIPTPVQERVEDSLGMLLKLFYVSGDERLKAKQNASRQNGL